jgi:uncharacterized protein (TIGR02722 family)
MKKYFAAHFLTGIVCFFSVGCGGPRAFTRGSYDDPNRVELLDDRFNESDMQTLAESIVKSISSCRAVVLKTSASRLPTVILDTVQNRTQEHIDMKSLQEKVQNALINSDKLQFIDKDARKSLQEEYDYNESGAVSARSKKERGKQIGADYLMIGGLATNIQEVGSDKFVYYKLNMKLTDLETSAISCSAEKEIRKKYKKRSIDL